MKEWLTYIFIATLFTTLTVAIITSVGMFVAGIIMCKIWAILIGFVGMCVFIGTFGYFID